MKPAYVARLHRNICREAECEFLDRVDYADQCAKCPGGHWGRYSAKGCDGVEQGTQTSRSVRPAGLRPAQWPLVLLPLKLLAREGDRGAGDIIARTIGPIGGEAFKAWYKRIFGKSCGCGARQDVLNARWPMQI